MSNDKPKKSKKNSESTSSDIGIKVKLEKTSRAFGKERITVTVSLTKDGEEIATDSDFISVNL